MYITNWIYFWTSNMPCSSSSSQRLGLLTTHMCDRSIHHGDHTLIHISFENPNTLFLVNAATLIASISFRISSSRRLQPYRWWWSWEILASIQHQLRWCSAHFHPLQNYSLLSGVCIYPNVVWWLIGLNVELRLLLFPTLTQDIRMICISAMMCKWFTWC
jgi:hypothetical protein